MKLYTRVLLTAGCIEYGVFAILCIGGFLGHPILYGTAGAWLAVSRRLVHRFFLPSLFPATTCPNCRLRISLTARMKCGSHWIDHRERHALVVYCNHGHEVGTFRCPNDDCGATIQLQKGDRRLLHDWAMLESQSLAASDQPSNVDRLRIGIQLHSIAIGWRRVARRWLRRPLGEPAYLPYDTLGKHGAVFGATGMGKSTLLISFARQVFDAGDGASVLDPAGDLARALLQQVPHDRIDDVIYLNVADQKFPFPFNILHAHDMNERNLLPDEIIGIFKRLYSREWGGTLAHQLRMAINVALETGGSFADVYDLFTSPESRRRIVRQVRDGELRHYWEETFPSSSLPSRMSIINKLTPIVKHPFLGPILCSRECIVDADETFLVQKVVAAAFRQGSLPEAQRARHVLVVDEFPRFIHRAAGFDQILSEARRYRLSLVVASQYVEQLDAATRAAIFGNVGALLSFRVGHRDAQLLSHEFTGSVADDLTELGVGRCLARIGNEWSHVRTLPPVRTTDQQEPAPPPTTQPVPAPSEDLPVARESNGVPGDEFVR